MEWLTQVRINWMERALDGLDWVARRHNRVQTLPAHLVTGMQGEDAAYFHLRRKGYIVAARRWSPGHQPGDIAKRVHISNSAVAAAPCAAAGSRQCRCLVHTDRADTCYREWWRVYGYYC